MDWIKQLNEVIDYIEDNLDKEILYDEIARISCCSIYNFQRMFSYIANKSLSEYIRNRRLTMSAFDLLNGKNRIIDIALKYGYDSQDSFTRAFKSFHNVLPSSVRNQTVQLKSCPKLSFQITIRGEFLMNYRIEQYPQFKVAGISKHIKTSEAFKIVPHIWETAWKDGTMQHMTEMFKKCDYYPAGFLGIASGGKWGTSDEMDYIIGVTNYVETDKCNYVAPMDGMSEFSYPAATWVIIEANGKLPDAVQKVYKEFYSQWLPNSGYKLANLPVIECYKQNDMQEVWIAIEK